MEFSLNPALTPEVFASVLAERGRVQVPDVLASEGAVRLWQALVQEVPWSFTYYDEHGAGVIEHSRLGQVPPEALRDLQQRLYAAAGSGFGYAYGLYHQDSSTRPDSPGSLTLERFFSFLAGDSMQRLVGALLGEPGPFEVDAQATRFGPGHFLGCHNDLMPGANRRCAYVFNFTREWRPDWGGYLQFFDAAGNGVDAFQPRFNSLTVFKVPQPHAVGYVPPFARGLRYAVSGWYRRTAPAVAAEGAA